MHLCREAPLLLVGATLGSHFIYIIRAPYQANMWCSTREPPVYTRSSRHITELAKLNIKHLGQTARATDNAPRGKHHDNVYIFYGRVMCGARTLGLA